MTCRVHGYANVFYKLQIFLHKTPKAQAWRLDHAHEVKIGSVAS